MECTLAKKKCDNNKYCEPSAGQCQSCDDLCLGNTPTDCKILCPDWKAFIGTTDAPDVPTSQAPINLLTVLIIMSAIMVVIVLVVVLLIFWHRKQKLQGSDSNVRLEKFCVINECCKKSNAMEIPDTLKSLNCICCKKGAVRREKVNGVSMENPTSAVNTENEELINKMRHRNEVKSNDTDRPNEYRSLNGSLVTNPSDHSEHSQSWEKPIVHGEHMLNFTSIDLNPGESYSIQESMASDYNGVNSKNPYSVEESRLPDETQPKSSPLMPSSQSTASNRLDSAEQLDASHLQYLSTDGSLCSRHMSMSLQLRSSNTLASGVNLEQPRERDPFDDVLQAYDAYDQHINQMSFVRGCRICNDQLQVYVTESGELDDHRERVMNVIPANVPSIIVSVAQQPRYDGSDSSPHDTGIALTDMRSIV